MDLRTSYLGLELSNPLVASPGPLTRSVTGIRRLAAAGVGAVVLPSLFEEQIRRETERDLDLAEAGSESFGEALSYLPVPVADGRPRQYLSLIERARAAVAIPVIASLNGATSGGWADYARSMQEAGASAIELNVYYLQGDPFTPGRDVEARYLEILRTVGAAVTIPIAVKLGPYLSSVGEMAIRLHAGRRRRARALQPLHAERHRSRHPDRRLGPLPLQPGRGGTAPLLDRPPAREGPDLAGRHHRGGERPATWPPTCSPAPTW